MRITFIAMIVFSMTPASAQVPTSAVVQKCEAPSVGFQSMTTAPKDGTVVEIETGHPKRINHKSIKQHNYGLFKYDADPHWPEPRWLSVEGDLFYRASDPCLYWRAYTRTGTYVAPDGKTSLERTCAELRSRLGGNTPIPMCNGVK